METEITQLHSNIGSLYHKFMCKTLYTFVGFSIAKIANLSSVLFELLLYKLQTKRKNVPVQLLLGEDTVKPVETKKRAGMFVKPA